MNTEITDNKVEPADRGWICYDGTCRFCSRLADRARPLLEPRGFRFAPLQTPWVSSRLGRLPGQPPAEMIVLTRDGRQFGGADAVIHLAEQVAWARPWCWLARVPAVRGMLHASYRWVARHRHCVAGACGTGRERRWPAWAPLALLPALTALWLRNSPPWIFMWTLAAAIFSGCKWLTWWPARRELNRHGQGTAFGYLLLWVGMDVRPFLSAETFTLKPRLLGWGFALLKTLVGVALIWGAVRVLPATAALLRGWVAMVGVVFLLHFGLFHLQALLWNRHGVPVSPLMNFPVTATSLAEFWGRRWNTGFHDLASAYLFRPLRRRTTLCMATLLTFAVSGLVHELVISVPARAGYGWPTFYFVLQGLGVIGERSRWGGLLGLGRGAKGQLFMLLVAALPSVGLFHPAFVRHVILPMLSALGAT